MTFFLASSALSIPYYLIKAAAEPPPPPPRRLPPPPEADPIDRPTEFTPGGVLDLRL